ncbi:hypothetical protein C1645_373041 [Glomus cerebriforme]|uniref:Uncharacterized protein n=1 Tax=Glomus cerebriforme TaxID=658196 RepID=A0A397TE86_9GLOM|nr:hypothetical protein C1645_373041 [Glomus cerebriforme]
MVKRQHRTSSFITRSRRNQNTELEQQKRFAFDMKRKRKSDIEADVPENDDIERQSPSYSNSNIVDSIKLKDKEPILSPSKRAKLSTMVGYNNNQFDIDDNIQTNVEIRGIKAENGIREGVRDSVHHRETLRNGIESRHMVQSSIKNGFDNVKEVTKDIAKNEDQINKQEDYKITEDNICNIEMIIDNFKDVIEIMGTQMVIGNYVIEYSDYQKFLTLLNKLMDILEMYDSDKILQSAKKIGCKRNTGQVLNSNLFRTKISKRAYKCLNEFQV